MSGATEVDRHDWWRNPRSILPGGASAKAQVCKQTNCMEMHSSGVSVLNVFSIYTTLYDIYKYSIYIYIYILYIHNINIQRLYTYTYVIICAHLVLWDVHTPIISNARSLPQDAVRKDSNSHSNSTIINPSPPWAAKFAAGEHANPTCGDHFLRIRFQLRGDRQHRDDCA